MEDVKESLTSLTLPSGPWIEETKVKLGQGHYGTVYEVKIRGLQCAGKKYDASLFSAEGQGSETAKCFVQLCQQLAGIRHPNVVQLLGVYFDSKSAPTLVSELLPFNLSTCLNEYLHIPNYAKSSILLDVACGLRYLHEQHHSVVHGRLTAEKVLLTVSMQAKICGVVNPARAALPDSSYTPPEAPNGELTTKGDVFSYGNLVLHVTSQTYPAPSEKEKADPDNPEQTVTHSEFERREQSVKQIGENHPLHGLVKQCLENEADNRPTMGSVMQEIEQYAISSPPPYANILQIMQEVEQMALIKENVKTLTQTLEAKQAEVNAKELEVDGLTQELEVKDKEVNACKEELEALKHTIQTKDRKSQLHDQALRAKDSLIKAKAREIVAKNQQISAKESLLLAANRRIETLEQRVAAGKKLGPAMQLPSTPQRTPTSRSHQVSPTYKESPFKFSQSAEAEDLATKAGEVLRRNVRGRKGRPTPMSDAGVLYQNWAAEGQKSGHQQVDPKLASILARRHQRYEQMESSDTAKHLEHSQQANEKEEAAHSSSDQVQLRQRSHSGGQSDMAPELEKIMEKRRSLLDLETVPDLSTDLAKQEPGPSQNKADLAEQDPTPSQNGTDPAKQEPDPSQDASGPTNEELDPSQDASGPADPSQDVSGPTKQEPDPCQDASGSTKQEPDPSQQEVDTSQPQPNGTVSTDNQQ